MRFFPKCLFIIHSNTRLFSLTCNYKSLKFNILALMFLNMIQKILMILYTNIKVMYLMYKNYKRNAVKYKMKFLNENYCVPF